MASLPCSDIVHHERERETENVCVRVCVSRALVTATRHSACWYAICHNRTACSDSMQDLYVPYPSCIECSHECRMECVDEYTSTIRVNELTLG